MVTDDADVLTALERGLRLSGFDMSSATNGDDALRMLKQATPETIAVGLLTVEMPERRACVDGVEIEFTRREFDLLAVLAEHSGAVLSRTQLLRLVCGNGHFAADTDVVDAFIGNVRRKLNAAGAPRLLHTVPGAGFVLRVQ
jgi:two-component system, OmpR family, response regulator PrrA